MLYSPNKYRETEGIKDQQNAIDKAKGIIARPMPRSWHDRHSANTIEDPETKRFYNSIVADKKPYFMRHIYPDLMRQYNKYIKNTDKSAMREFQMPMSELLALPELTERQADFIRYYYSRMPVGLGDCVMNKICRRFEEEFDHYLKVHNQNTEFDYRVLKSGAEYSKAMYKSIGQIFSEYSKRLRSFAVASNYERMDEYEAFYILQQIKDEFTRGCAMICPNSRTLCDILLDLCYTTGTTKRFVWDICGEEIIENLLEKNNSLISYPVKCEDGDIVYCGERFCVLTQEVDRENELDIE